MKRVVAYFFQGLLLIAPIAVTALIVVKIFVEVGLLFNEVGIKVHPSVDPIIGVFSVILLIAFVGLLSSTFIFKPIFSLFENIIGRMPLIKIIYSALKDLFSAFVSDKKKFKKPVLVTIDVSSGIQKIGFLTKEDLTTLGIKDKVAVYFPFSYGVMGNLLLVPRKNIVSLEGVSSADVMKFTISGGVTEISEKKKKTANKSKKGY